MVTDRALVEHRQLNARPVLGPMLQTGKPVFSQPDPHTVRMIGPSER